MAQRTKPGQNITILCRRDFDTHQMFTVINLGVSCCCITITSEAERQQDQRDGDRLVEEDYRYLGVVSNNKLAWKGDVEAVYKQGMSRLFFMS